LRELIIAGVKAFVKNGKGGRRSSPDLTWLNGIKTNIENID
jgi:hypothetical protein